MLDVTILGGLAFEPQPYIILSKEKPQSWGRSSVVVFAQHAQGPRFNSQHHKGSLKLRVKS